MSPGQHPSPPPRRTRLDPGPFAPTPGSERRTTAQTAQHRRPSSTPRPPHERPAPRDPGKDGGHRLGSRHRDGHEREPHYEETQTSVPERAFHLFRLAWLPIQVSPTAPPPNGFDPGRASAGRG